MTIKIGSESGTTGTLERWIDVARKQERLAVNRVEEIKLGAAHKTQRKRLQVHTKRLKTLVQKYKAKSITQAEYWEAVDAAKRDITVYLY